MSAGILFDAPGPKARARHRVLTAIGALLALGLAYLVWHRLDQRGQLRSALWTPLTKPELWNDYLIPGLQATLKAAFFSILLAAVFGSLMAMLRLAEIPPLRWLAGAVVEFFRAVPVLLMMIFLWGVLIAPLGSDGASFWGVVGALTLYNGAVICEVIRSGVDQLPNGQREAGLSIGLTPGSTLRTILLPQAVTAMLPTLVSQLVVILKDTALGYNIMFPELLNSAKDAGSNYQNMLPTLLLVAVLYIVTNYLVTKAAEWLERRINRRGHTAGTPDAHGGPPAVGVAVAGPPGVDATGKAP